MLTTFLLAAALQSSSVDDCAILEAITPAQIEADIVMREGEYLGSTEFSGMGRAIFVSTTPLIYASVETLYGGRANENPSSINSLLMRANLTEPIIVVNRWRATANREERLASARTKFEGHADYIHENIADIPEGLFENFIVAATDDTAWNCPAGDFAIFSSDDEWQLMDSLLPYGTGTNTYRFTRPGYSHDGNWALVHESRESHGPQLILPDGSEIPGRSHGGLGHILLVREDSGTWSVVQYFPGAYLN